MIHPECAKIIWKSIDFSYGFVGRFNAQRLHVDKGRMLAVNHKRPKWRFYCILGSQGNISLKS